MKALLPRPLVSLSFFVNQATINFCEVLEHCKLPHRSEFYVLGLRGQDPFQGSWDLDAGCPHTRS